MKKLLKLGIVAGLAVAAVKVLSAKKPEWQNLSETELREKLDTKLPRRLPDEKRSAIADKVVAKLDQKGRLRADSEA